MSTDCTSTARLHDALTHKATTVRPAGSHTAGVLMYCSPHKVLHASSARISVHVVMQALVAILLQCRHQYLYSNLTRQPSQNLSCTSDSDIAPDLPVKKNLVELTTFAINMSNVGQGANKPYPQQVTLDAAKAEAAQMQSEASKAHGGQIPKDDPASAARVSVLHLIVALQNFHCGSTAVSSFVHAFSMLPFLTPCSCLTYSWLLQSAASQSQHVVNILTSGDPVNAGHVSQAAKNEAGPDGQVPKGGAASTIQVPVSSIPLWCHVLCLPVNMCTASSSDRVCLWVLFVYLFVCGCASYSSLQLSNDQAFGPVEVLWSNLVSNLG